MVGFEEIGTEIDGHEGRASLVEGSQNQLVRCGLQEEFLANFGQTLDDLCKDLDTTPRNNALH